MNKNSCGTNCIQLIILDLLFLMLATSVVLIISDWGIMARHDTICRWCWFDYNDFQHSVLQDVWRVMIIWI